MSSEQAWEELRRMKQSLERDLGELESDDQSEDEPLPYDEEMQVALLQNRLRQLLGKELDS